MLPEPIFFKSTRLNRAMIGPNGIAPIKKKIMQTATSAMAALEIINLDIIFPSIPQMQMNPRKVFIYAKGGYALANWQVAIFVVISRKEY
jgi:hypothetical protein